MKIIPMTTGNYVVPMTPTPMDLSIEDKEQIRKNEVSRK